MTIREVEKATNISKEDFHFPMKPYGIQLDFMKQLYDTIENNRIGIFSSPTGTGKSLSLLCGSLKWLLDYRFKIQQANQGKLTDEATADSIDSLAHLANEPLWVQDYARKQLAEKQRDQLQQEVECSIHLRKRKKLQHVSDVLQNLRDSAGYDSDCSDGGNNKESPQSRPIQPVQIIYASRTHSQLSQFVSELKRTEYASEYDIRSISLGSRKQMCINPDIKKLKNVNLINDKCKELQSSSNKCQFMGGDYEDLQKKSFQNVSDIEDLVKFGNQAHYCPYYGARKMLPHVEIVTVPYSILLSSNTRKALNISLHNSVIIIDEAHNLIDAIAQLHGIEMSSRKISDSIECLQSYIKKYAEKFSGDNLVCLKQILMVLRKIHIFMTKSCEKSDIMKIQEFLVKIRAENFNLFQLVKFFESSDLCRKSQSFVQTKQLQVEIDEEKYESSASPLYSVKEFMEMLVLDDDHGRILVELIDKENADYKVKYMLLDPSEPFSDIVEGCKSLILAGGTMEPLDEVFSQLLPLVPRERISVFNCSHVIPNENLKMLIVPSGVSKIKFEFDYKSRDNPSLISELGKSIDCLSKNIPGGLVLFFPSFDFLYGAVEKWKQTGVFAKFNITKKVFIEPRSANEVADVLAKYEKCIETNSLMTNDRTGAALLCVVGGKLSEGINFANDLARTVIVVGLPFPNIKSPELVKKMEYLDMKHKKNPQNTISSKDYYENLCMKAVNQSIGRAIRHQNDYAVILLFDQRYGRPRIKQKLPGWMQNSLVPPDEHLEFSMALTHINSFFDYHRQKKM